MTPFEDYRERMLSIVAIGEQALSRADPPGNTEVLDLGRARMSRILTAYHLYADRELFTPCLGRTDPVQRARVREISAECATLAEEFRAFSRQCTARPVIGRWTEYRVSALALMARIRRHLNAAEAEIRRCEALDAPTQLAS